MKLTGTHLGVLVIVLYFTAQSCMANEIYINQIGDNVDLTITQDGENNKIGDLNNLSNKGLIGSFGPSTFTYTQTGNNNTLGIYNADIGDSSSTLTQTGDNNAAVIDCHGEDCTMSVTQLGDNNDAHAEAGSSYDHNGNTITIYQEGDYNESYAEADGDNNDLDSYQESDNNFSRVVVSGNSNVINAWQGKHDDGTTDTDETGDHEVYWTVTGDNNILDSYQTDTNRQGGGGAGHHIANVVDGDNNGVTHTQMGKAGHDGFIEITGDNNEVDLYQRGNGGVKWSDIVLDGDGHTVDVNQRGSQSATAAIDLTNSGGAYNYSLTQNVTTSADSVSITGYCTNANGCSIIVNRNN
jgi:hypothetical protein